MKRLPLILLGGLCISVISGCTGHRRDETPTPDGDTIEVVIKTPETPAPDAPLPETTPEK